MLIFVLSKGCDTGMLRNCFMGQQVKRRMREVEEVMSKGKEEMEKAVEKMRQDNELRIKTLEEQHSKKEAQLKNQYEAMLSVSCCTPAGAREECVAASVASCW